MTEETRFENGNAPRLDAAQWRAVIQQVPLFFKVTSASMAPTFRAGEHVSIRPLREGEPRRGQVLAYFSGMLITHRYLGGGVCMGDNALIKDPPIDAARMVGIVTAVRRNGRVLDIGNHIPAYVRMRRLLMRAVHAVRCVKKVSARMLLSLCERNRKAP